jgi:hypothetical protein
MQHSCTAHAAEVPLPNTSRSVGACLTRLLELIAAVEGSYRYRKARFLGAILTVILLTVLVVWLSQSAASDEIQQSGHGGDRLVQWYGCGSGRNECMAHGH